MSFYSVWGTGPGDVYAFGDDVFACGRSCRTDSAVVLHYDGANWQGTLTRPPHGIATWRASSADILVVGWGGYILHYDGTRWRREDSGTTDAILAISGTSERDVWAVTSSGLVLHGTR